MTFLSVIETTKDQSLFEQIYYTYRKQMFYVANQILKDNSLAEDAVQEAFLGIAKQITLFRDMADNQVKAYVFIAAKNAAINLYKQEQKNASLYARMEEAEPGFAEDETLDRQIGKETYQILTSAISSLPAFQRDILVLRYSNNMNCAQIAAALGKKPSTVRKELSRARKALRAACKKEGLEIED